MKKPRKREHRMPLNHEAIYDPNTDTDESQRAAALHWELLRRNSAFQTVAQRWIAEPGFRLQHAKSEDYHHPQVQFQRCALDWMLPSDSRVELARAQIAGGMWAKDPEFNFGLLVARTLLPPWQLTWKNLPECVEVRRLSKASLILSVDQSWPNTNPKFREQFGLAVNGDAKFRVCTEEISNAGDQLRVMAGRLARDEKIGQGR